MALAAVAEVAERVDVDCPADFPAEGRALGLEARGVPIGARTTPSPNAGKVVKVRWVKPYAEATNQVCVGEVVRETPQYLVVRGIMLNFRKGDTEPRRDRECVRWIPWTQIAAVTELPTGLKWRQTQFKIDEAGQVVVC